MRQRHEEGDIVIVGAGPAGIAAACAAAEAGREVTLIDDNPAAGGQIWRAGGEADMHPEADAWMKRLRATTTQFLSGTRVAAGDAARRTLLLEDQSEAAACSYRELILCTGARELFLPFPGWTLPNVMGAGGLQALVKSGLPVEGKRVVVAGSGPLLLAVAAYLRSCGASVPLIAEQAPRSKLAQFGAGLLRHPAKLAQGISLKFLLTGVPYFTGTWIAAAEGDGRVERVSMCSSASGRSGSRTWSEECDYVAMGYGLVPNTELAEALDCRIRDGYVAVDNLQRSSVPHIFCAGEPTGIGGVELALLEGEIAGHTAAGRADLVISAVARRNRQTGFKAALAKAFSPRGELRSLPQPETIVCRCEDATWSRLNGMQSWRAAKLQTRCGMGPCQGRICGPATEFLFGWKVESVRAPIFPVRVESLIGAGGHESESPI